MKVAWPTAESVLATSSLPERTYADGLVFRSATLSVGRWIGQDQRRRVARLSAP